MTQFELEQSVIDEERDVIETFTNLRSPSPVSETPDIVDLMEDSTVQQPNVSTMRRVRVMRQVSRHSDDAHVHV